MERNAIISIDGIDLLCHDVSGAAQVLGLIKSKLSSSGYGEDKTYEVDPKTEITMHVISAAKVNDPSSESDAVEMLIDSREQLKKVESAKSEAEDALKREKAFWRVRKSAHAKGLSDEKLRAQLKSCYTFQLNEFQPKAEV